MNLAVGIVGDEANPLNLSLFGILLVAAIGSVCVLFRANGMVFAMTAAAGAQAGGGVMASRQGHNIWLFTIFTALVWLASAWLFRKAH